MKTRSSVVWVLAWILASLLGVGSANAQNPNETRDGTIKNLVHDSGSKHYQWSDVKDGRGGVAPTSWVVHYDTAKKEYSISKTTPSDPSYRVASQNPPAGTGNWVDVIVVDWPDGSGVMQIPWLIYVIGGGAFILGVLLSWFINRKPKPAAA